MKKWKKTKRERKNKRERKLINIPINLPKEYLLALRAESQRTNKSINKIIGTYLTEAINSDLKKIREEELEESKNDN